MGAGRPTDCKLLGQAGLVPDVSRLAHRHQPGPPDEGPTVYFNFLCEKCGKTVDCEIATYRVVIAYSKSDGESHEYRIKCSGCGHIYQVRVGADEADR